MVGRLEAAQQFVEGVQHLFGEAFAHLVLELAAGGKQGRRGVGAAGTPNSRCSSPSRARMAVQMGRPAGLKHVADAEVKPARAFAAGCGDET